MKVGVLARVDNRGIGIQTWEAALNLPADRVLAVREPGAERMGFAPDLDRYPDATVVTFNPDRVELPEPEVRAFLDGLDVLYIVESAYDYRLYRWAREARCATVVHANPEFWRWSDPTLDRPDVWWLPTSWRADTLPDECRVVPVPCPRPPADMPAPMPENAPVRFVHVIGHRAVADRNGTQIVQQALRHLVVPASLRIECQDAGLASPGRVRRDVQVETRCGGVADRWDLYRDAEVLILPRRYGGLCLPVLEALACGLVVVMSAVEPQVSTWPIVGLVADERRSMALTAGRFTLADVRPGSLARAMMTLAAQPAEVARLSRESLQWAADHSWDALRPAILDELHHATTMRRSS